MSTELTPDQFIDYYCQRAQIAWECLRQHPPSLPHFESSSVYLIQPSSGWLTEMLKWLPTALIAAVAVYVAWQQYGVARRKLKLDLFDKRYAIFEEVWTILSSVVQNGTRTKNYGLATPFNNLLPKSAFLFGKDVEDYLVHVSRQWTELWALELPRPGYHAIPADDIAKARELRDWFEKQASSGVRNVFGRYLSFDGWK